MAYPQVINGVITSTGSAYTLQLPFVPTKFETFNYTNAASTANPGVVKRAVWQSGMADASYVGVKNTAGAATDTTVVATSGGFTPFDTSLDNQLQAVKTGTAVSTATPPEVTINSHGYSNNDIVLIYGTTGALQIAGMPFTINNVAGNTFDLPYMATLAVAATAVKARKFNYQDPFSPRVRYVTAITQAASAVVTMSVTHGYSVGEKISFRVPAAFGMVEMDGLTGQITAINTTTNTITVDIDSSGFTAFAFPAAAAFPNEFALAVPAGQDSSVVSVPYFNNAAQGIILGSDVAGAASDVIYYTATLSN